MYRTHALTASALLSLVLLCGGCSTAVSDLTSPTSDFWDRRPCVGGARATAPREAPPRAFVRRQAPPDCGVPQEAPSASFPAPRPRATTPERTAGPLRATPRGPDDALTSAEEMRVLSEVNAIRAQHSLRPLRFNGQLWTAARDHSAEQQQHGYMGHGSPDPERRRLSQRMALAGYEGSVFGEVVAWGYPSVSAVIAGWMNSPDHRRILLDREMTEGAFSRVGKYWTGNLGAPARFGRVSVPRASAPPRAAPRAVPRAPAPAPRAVPRAVPRPAPAPRAAPQPAPRAAPKALPLPGGTTGFG